MSANHLPERTSALTLGQDHPTSLQEPHHVYSTVSILYKKSAPALDALAMRFDLLTRATSVTRGVGLNELEWVRVISMTSVDCCPSHV